MSKLTGDMIKQGLHIWVAAPEKTTCKLIPVEMIVVTGEVERDGKVLHVVFADEVTSKAVFSVSSDPRSDFQRYVIYLGDDGVKPYAYDNRCTQVFTTKESMQAAIDMWNGRYPNFVTEDGETIERDTSYLDDWEDYMCYE